MVAYFDFLEKVQPFFVLKVFEFSDNKCYSLFYILKFQKKEPYYLVYLTHYSLSCRSRLASHYMPWASNHLDKRIPCRDTTTLACGISGKMKDETIFAAISGQQLAGFIEVHPPTSLAAHRVLMATKYWRFARFPRSRDWWFLLSYVKERWLR